ncbi:MAG: SDR family oxidoreductase [Bacteroidales bacterium]|nr:SDR family oxidoreductase [Bacteroidales bacterium]
MEKSILIVGAASAMGQELVRQQLQAGHSVYTTSRKALEKQGEKHIHAQFNIVESDFPEGFLPDSLDGLVYLPGTINLKPFRALKPEAFLEDFQVNVMGGIKTIHKIQKSFNPGSSIVMFSTVAVQRGMAYHSSVAVSKGAVEGLVRTLAAELAPKVRVNAIAPSLTHTPMSERMINTDDKLKAMKERHPLKEIGQPRDMASMVSYLLSDNARWITGQIMHIDGGLSTLNK